MPQWIDPERVQSPPPAYSEPAKIAGYGVQEVPPPQPTPQNYYPGPHPQPQPQPQTYYTAPQQTHQDIPLQPQHVPQNYNHINPNGQGGHTTTVTQTEEDFSLGCCAGCLCAACCCGCSVM